MDKGHGSVHPLQSQPIVRQADATPVSFKTSDLGDFADLVRPFSPVSLLEFADEDIDGIEKYFRL